MSVTYLGLQCNLQFTSVTLNHVDIMISFSTYLLCTLSNSLCTGFIHIKGVFPSAWYRVYCGGGGGGGDNSGHFTSRTCGASAKDCTPSWASGNNLVLPTTRTLHLMSLQTSVTPLGLFSEE